MTRKAMIAACLLAPLGFAVEPGPPWGKWFLAGSRPREYDCNADAKAKYNDQESTVLGLKDAVEPTGFGTWMTQFSAERYLGRRVRFTANVRTEGIQSLGVNQYGAPHGWAGLWMRVDDENKPRETQTIAFDNMQRRSITGSTPWKSYSVVLDVDKHATKISLGILLDGAGEAWLNSPVFEVVDRKVRTTGMNR